MQSLSSFVHAHRDEIVQAWLAEAGQLPASRGLTAPALRDHIPELIDAMADALARGDTTARPANDLPLVHAAQRWREGYDLRQVVAEYRQLRAAIFAVYCRDRRDLLEEGSSGVPGLAALNEHIDRAIADAVDQYTAERESVRRTLIGVLGHDLRDPLNLVALVTQTLLRTPARFEPHELNMLMRSEATIQRMRRLIDDLMAFAMANTQRGIPATLVPVDLSGIVQGVVAEFAAAHEGRELLCGACDASGGLRGRFDPDRVSQVVANLVANALKHGSDPIVVEAFDEGGCVAIEVRSGGEVPPELRPLLFKAFATPARADGTGLGLFIVRQIALAHGGSAEARHEPGTTTLRVVLPKGGGPGLPPASTVN